MIPINLQKTICYAVWIKSIKESPIFRGSFRLYLCSFRFHCLPDEATFGVSGFIESPAKLYLSLVESLNPLFHGMKWERRVNFN